MKERPDISGPKYKAIDRFRIERDVIELAAPGIAHATMTQPQAIDEAIAVESGNVGLIAG